jgi:hypothetical protein
MEPTSSPAEPSDDPEAKRLRDQHYIAADILRSTLPLLRDETAEQRSRRENAALLAIGGLVPGNAAESRLAAHHVAAMAHAEQCLRDAAPYYAYDPKRANQLSAQAARMGREARGYLNALLRAQAIRTKRDGKQSTRDSAAWTERAAVGLMSDALAAQPPPVLTPPTPAMAAATRAGLAAEMPAADGTAAAPVAPAGNGRARRGKAQAQTFPPLRDYSEWTDEEKRIDRLRWEAGHYAVLNTMRVQEMRKLGGLPPNCNYEPPRPELLQEILTGNHSNLRWADTYVPYTGPLAPMD